MELELKKDWGFYATFVPNKKLPLYNWYYYKEGFARELVFKLLDLFDMKNGLVLDPFCGSGTTLLACKERGIESIGLEILPGSLLASRVKTRNYSDTDLFDIESCLNEIRKEKFEKPRKEPLPILKKCFPRHNLDDLMFLKRIINRYTITEAREFMLLALINAAMKCSWVWKDGGVLKVKQRPVAPLKKMFFRVANKMIREAENYNNRSLANSEVRAADAREIPLLDSSVDCIITSPPYLNQIDYTKVYAIENWIAGDVDEAGFEPPLRSFLGLGKTEDFMPYLPPQASAYFKDMDVFLKEAYRVCKNGARIAIVIGNAYFPPPYSPVECDMLVSGLAKNIGFTIDNIFVLNERAALRNRTEKVGTLRESIVILTK